MTTKFPASRCTDLVAAWFSPDTAYMPVPRCDQCRHWKPREESANRPWMKVDGTGVCGRVFDATRDSKMWPDEYDHIITDADFGCVQWEAKVAEK